MYRMDVQDFRAWLASRPPYEVVGKAACENGCPIARWMADFYHQAFGVTGSWVYDADGVSFSAPLWVVSFVVALDALYDSHPSTVSAESALRILDEVLVEVSCAPSPC